jgi:hypothetical protein
MLSRYTQVLVSMLSVAVAVCAWLFPVHPIGPSPMVKSNASSNRPSLDQSRSQTDQQKTGKAWSDKETPKQSELFPIYGVTLGKTTVSELGRLGTKGKYFDYYKIRGFNFWYENNVASKMDLVQLEGKLPEIWTSLGFDWGLSFNKLTELLKLLGYSVNVTKSPMIKHYSGHDSFFADIEATKFSGIPTKIQFGFRYSKGTTADSLGTLYKMTVQPLKND